MYIVLFIVALVISICFGIVSYYSMSNDQNILIVRWFQMSGIMIALFMDNSDKKKCIRVLIQASKVMKGMGGVVVGLYDGLEVKIKKSQ